MSISAPLADIAAKFDYASMQMPSNDEAIEKLRERHREAFAQLQRARADGDKAQTRAWEAAFKRISALRYEAGDNPDAPIF